MPTDLLVDTPIKVYLDRNFINAFKPDHTPSYMLAMEWSHPCNPDEAKDLLASVFSTLNVGSPMNDIAQRWRRKGFRSMSVGDAAIIGEVAFRCDPVGWSVLDPQEILSHCP